MSLLRRILVCVWAAPCSALGLIAGLPAAVLGARIRMRAGAMEIAGGLLGAALSRLPPRMCFSAITLGHVILGVDLDTLDEVREHEQVHVRQYERWGPLFIPAYLLSSLFQLVRGRRPYLDNHFEREACATTGPCGAESARAFAKGNTSA
ncbi:MAG: signal peptide prediction [Ramlibacter sp.]